MKDVHHKITVSDGFTPTCDAITIDMGEMQDLLRFLTALGEQEDARRLLEKFNREHNSRFGNEVSLTLIIDQLNKMLNEIHLRFFKVETDAAGFPKGIFE